MVTALQTPAQQITRREARTPVAVRERPAPAARLITAIIQQGIICSGDKVVAENEERRQGLVSISSNATSPLVL